MLREERATLVTPVYVQYDTCQFLLQPWVYTIVSENICEYNDLLSRHLDKLEDAIFLTLFFIMTYILRTSQNYM